MKSQLKFFIPVALISLVFLVWVYYPRLTLISGFAAKNMCSCVFEAGRKPQVVASEDNDFGPVTYAGHSVDRANRQVTASVFGLKPRTAAYQPGIGCILLPADEEPSELPRLVPNRTGERSNAPYPYGQGKYKDTLFPEVDYSHLKGALENAFCPENKTRAVVILYKDHLIMERYQEGYSSESKFLGWSMTKSITGAILGVLEKRGAISLAQDSLFPQWSKDQRAAITVEDMLQMRSGLEWEEDYSKISDVTTMLFMAEDMSKVQLNQPLVDHPGTLWNYSSGTTNLLGRFIRNQFDSQQAYLDFWYAELIDKIGMHSMVLETDMAGSYVGSSYAWATARDWAKFGQLYLNGGYWKEEQLLSASWVKYSVTPVPGSEGQYGAHFWLNVGGAYPNVPRDLFSANGFQGQYIFIIPSEELVVVRFGLKEHPEFDVDRFLSDVLGAFSP